MKHPIQAIFFDFDGTIAETEPDIRNCWHCALDKLKIQPKDFDGIFRVGPSAIETAKMLFPDLPDDEVRHIAKTYMATYDTGGLPLSSPYPWTLDAIKVLHQRGKKLYCATNKRLNPTLTLCRRFGLLDKIDGFFTPDIISTENHITKNELVQLGQRVSGELPEHCLMVGDTPIDVQAGKAAPMHTIGVCWGYGKETDLRASLPDLIVTDTDFIRAFDSCFI